MIMVLCLEWQGGAVMCIDGNGMGVSLVDLAAMA